MSEVSFQVMENLKRLRWLLLPLTLTLTVAAPSTAAVYTPDEEAWYQDGPDGRYLLDGSWYIRQDPNDEGAGQNWQRQDSLDNWKATGMPHSCNGNDLSEASYNGSVCWLRTDFKLPQNTDATNWALRFESVNYLAKVWINEEPIGQHRGDFLPFELLAHKLKKTGTNRLVVRVDGRRTYGDLPPADKLGWWNWVGINREVYLRKVGKLDTSNFSVKPVLPCSKCTASVHTELTVRNYTDHEQKGVTGTITGPGGFKRKLKFNRKTFPARKFAKIKAKTRVGDPALWSPTSPNLYQVSVKLGNQEKPATQVMNSHVGIRKWQVDPLGRVLLNGKAINLRGAAIHEYAPGKGAALAPKNHKANINLLGKLHANFTRTHYPFHPYFLELADRKGVVVWGETPFYQLPNDYLSDKDIRARGVRMIDEMVHRDQNHASILSYSIFNELSSRPDDALGQRYYIKQACHKVEEVQPEALCAAAVPGYPSVAAQRAYRDLDIIGLNLYFGWYKGPNDQIIDRNGLSGYLDQVHSYYPDKGLFATEFGAEAGCSGEASVKGTYEFQNDWLQFTLDTIDSKAFINGASVWALKNFMVKPNWTGGADTCIKSPQHQKGLTDTFGAKKPSFDIVAQRYAKTSWFRP